MAPPRRYSRIGLANTRIFYLCQDHIDISLLGPRRQFFPWTTYIDNYLLGPLRQFTFTGTFDIDATIYNISRYKNSLIIVCALYPFFGFPQNLHQLSLFSTLSPKISHILPSHRLRESHQDTLDSCSRSHETELSSPINDEIELNVTTATDKLPTALQWCIWHRVSSRQDRHV